MKIKTITKTGEFDFVFDSKDYKNLEIQIKENFVEVTTGYKTLTEFCMSDIKKIIIT